MTTCCGDVLATVGSMVALVGVGIDASTDLPTGDVPISLGGVVTLGCGLTTSGIVWEVVVLGLDEKSLSLLSSTHLGVPSLYPVGLGLPCLSVMVCD